MVGGADTMSLCSSKKKKKKKMPKASFSMNS